MAGEDSDREIFVDPDRENLYDNGDAPKDTVPDVYAPTEIFSPDSVKDLPRTITPTPSEDKRSPLNLIVLALKGEVSVSGAGNAYVRRRINDVARREARKELRRRGKIALGDAKEKTGELAVLVDAKTRDLTGRSLTFTEKFAKASLEETVEGAIAARQVYIDLSRPNAVIPLVYQELKRYGRFVSRITNDYIVPFIADVVGPRVAKGTISSAKWMYRKLLTPAGKAIKNEYKERVSKKLRRKSVLKKLEKGIGKTFGWLFGNALPYVRDKVEDFYDDHISHRIGRKTKLAIVIGIPLALGGLYLASDYRDSGSRRPAGVFERVAARDKSTAVYRYNPTLDDRREGINPYEIAQKFDNNYRHCQTDFSWRDLRYADGRRVFPEEPQHSRIREVRKPVYFRIEKGPCAPRRKR